MSAWFNVKIDPQANTNIGLMNTRISLHTSIHDVHYIYIRVNTYNKYYTLEVCKAGGGGEGVRFVTKAKCSFPARPRRPN